MGLVMRGVHGGGSIGGGLLDADLPRVARLLDEAEVAAVLLVARLEHQLAPCGGGGRWRGWATSLARLGVLPWKMERTCKSWGGHGGVRGVGLTLKM